MNGAGAPPHQTYLPAPLPGVMAVAFLDRLDRSLARTNSLLCVGLDPDPDLLPRALGAPRRVATLDRFLRGVVDATLPFAGAYKMQLASYMNYGPAGLASLAKIAKAIGAQRPTILDLKANDFPNTMRLYHDAVVEHFGVDAVTLTPWMGRDSLEPFAEDPAHGFFLVAHSSNPGSADLQDPPRSHRPAWVEVVRWARQLERANRNAGVVIGATYPTAVARARRLLGPTGAILLPGIGAQKGALEESVRAGIDRRGRGLLVAASRSIAFASRGRDWAEAAATAAARLTDQINAARR